MSRSRPTFVSSPSLYADVPYEYAAVASAGNTVFTAGACPLDSEPSRPPSTLLGVAFLGYPEQLVEIEGIASIA